MILIDKLKEFLDKTGMTREEFSKKADVPLSTLNTLLSKDDANPTYMTTMKIARAANISLDEIGGIISEDMGNEEIERIKKSYAKNEEAIKKTLDDYAAQIAHKEEIEAHDKEIIRRQDLRIQNLENTIKNLESHENEIIQRQDTYIHNLKDTVNSLEDRVVYQKQAIRRHIIAVAILLFVIVLLVGFIVSIYMVSPTKNIFA